ncbi:aryl-sulfate sulfotransferase [candidate division KSB1 bacterium]|nr:aryl-sulfate sulfotransferase [candidate division KSB1 bacterium]
MKRLIILMCVLISTSCLLAGNYHTAVQYVFPLPDSKALSDRTTIIIRFLPKFTNQIENLDGLIQVTGSVNGPYQGRTFFSTDGCTIIFKPNSIFQRDDQVTVKVQTSVFGFDDFTFDFSIESKGANVLNKTTPFVPTRKIVEAMPAGISSEIRVINGVAVPSDFPKIITTQTDQTAPGKIFYSSRFRETIDSYIIAVENDGTPYMFNRFDGMDDTANFVRQCNGTFSVFFFGPRFHAILDDQLNIIDIYRGGHGYEPDEHDFLILENGHALMILEEHIRVDMSKVVTGGSTNALVHGNMFQEYDKDKNVIFEFRSWDHFRFEDVYGINLRDATVDYIHMNSIAPDYDGHYLLSSKHLDEITKINRDNGEIIWRLGGKNNQFTFINEGLKFSYQHHVRTVPGKPGHITLFDNGNMRSPDYSRAVEYKIDSDNMTAEKVWEYQFSPAREAYWMGSVQRLPNGNSFIDCSTTSPAMAIEVTPKGEKLFQMLSYGSASYRSFRYDLNVVYAAPFFLLENFGYTVNLIFNKFGDKNVAFYKIYHRLEDETEFTVMDTTKNTWYQAIGLQSPANHVFKVSAVSKDGKESECSEEIIAKVAYAAPDLNLISNGEFRGKTGWYLRTTSKSKATGSISSEGYTIDIEEGGESLADIRLWQLDILLIKGQEYTLEFDAYAEDNRTITAELKMKNAPYTNYSKIGYIPLSKKKQHFSYTFTMEDNTDEESMLVFECGQFDTNITLDNVLLKMTSQTTVKESAQSAPETLQLYQNYPNPFNPATTILYSLEKDGLVHLKLYSLTGQELKTLVNEYQNKGNHQVELNAENLPSGMYFYKLSVGNESRTRKLMVLK